LVWAGYAAQAQTPSHESLQGWDFYDLPVVGTSLLNARSRQVVAGFERPLFRWISLRIEGYHRRFDRLLAQALETDAERATRLASYILPPDLPGDAVVLEYRPTVHPENSGRGTADGV